MPSRPPWSNEYGLQFSAPGLTMKVLYGQGLPGPAGVQANLRLLGSSPTDAELPLTGPSGPLQAGDAWVVGPETLGAPRVVYLWNVPYVGAAGSWVQAFRFIAPPGPKPAHQWDGSGLRLENPDGSWGQWTNLRGPRGFTGRTPEHEWSGTSLRFELGSSTPEVRAWGPFVNLRGPRGLQGVQGAQGPQGIKGDAGNYLGLTFNGVVLDVALLPPPETVPDEQWAVATGTPPDGMTTVWFSDGTQWTNLGPITAPAAFPVAHTIYVQGFGSDANSGSSLSTAVRHIERALELATLREEPTLIEWYPERDVVTQGHLDMPDDCVIIAKHRAVFVRPEPGFEERNVFRMGSGCFLEGVMFEGWRVDSLTNPTSGFAVSFRPGALIRRVPYAHKIAVRNEFPGGAGGIPPPLDAANGNPLVPRGGGVVLADGLVCSQYSPFPNIMTWGATPVCYNGLGYVARRGGLINAVNAVSMWAHKHFMALEGGQIILSACSTQFGDWAMNAKGYREVVQPAPTALALTVHGDATSAIEDATQDIIDAMWLDLTTTVNPETSLPYASGWTAMNEQFTRYDAAVFLQCLRWVLDSADDAPLRNFVRGLFDVMGQPVFASDKLAAFQRSFTFMATTIAGLPGVTTPAAALVNALVVELNAALASPPRRREVSRITAIGHTWTATRAGVALFKIPPAQPVAPITDSILEEDDGVVVATGQDDYGNALLARGPNGTLEVDSVFGLKGALFENAVRRSARKFALMGSF
jgi:hypothetical protein